MPVSEARDRLADLVNQVHYGRERVLLLRRGEVVAGLVSHHELAQLEEQMTTVPVTSMWVKRQPPNSDQSSYEVIALQFDDDRLARLVVLDWQGTPVVWKDIDKLEFSRQRPA